MSLLRLLSETNHLRLKGFRARVVEVEEQLTSQLMMASAKGQRAIKDDLRKVRRRLKEFERWHYTRTLDSDFTAFVDEVSAHPMNGEVDYS